MKKKIIVGLVIGLTVSLLSGGSIVIVRAEEFDEPVIIETDVPYENVSNACCALSITSGTASIRSEVYGEYGTTSTSVTVYLEKLVNGSWQSYSSWSHSGGSNLDNTDYCYDLSHGAYRVWMSVSATGLGGSESFNVDGNTVGY